MRHLLKVVDTYRVSTVEEVEQLHEELLDNPNFTLTAYSYKTKYIKAKGEIIDEYYKVSLTKLFTDIKDPTEVVTISYEVD